MPNWNMCTQFRYLGTTVTNQNVIPEEIDVWYCLLPLGPEPSVFTVAGKKKKNLKIRIYKTIILPVYLYGCETLSLTLREEHRQVVLETVC
jgi:hypothetical protein